MNDSRPNNAIAIRHRFAAASISLMAALLLLPSTAFAHGFMPDSGFIAFILVVPFAGLITFVATILALVSYRRSHKKPTPSSRLKGAFWGVFLATPVEAILLSLFFGGDAELLKSSIDTVGIQAVAIFILYSLIASIMWWRNRNLGSPWRAHPILSLAMAFAAAGTLSIALELLTESKFYPALSLSFCLPFAVACLACLSRWRKHRGEGSAPAARRHFIYSLAMLAGMGALSALPGIIHRIKCINYSYYRALRICSEHYDKILPSMTFIIGAATTALAIYQLFLLKKKKAADLMAHGAGVENSAEENSVAGGSEIPSTASSPSPVDGVENSSKGEASPASSEVSGQKPAGEESAPEKAEPAEISTISSTATAADKDILQRLNALEAENARLSKRLQDLEAENARLKGKTDQAPTSGTDQVPPTSSGT